MKLVHVLIAQFVVASALGFTACPPPPQPPTDVDVEDTGAGDDATTGETSSDNGLAPDATDVQAACGILAAAGCAEGGPRCVTVVQHALDTHISAMVTPAVVSCLAKASPNVAAVRACGVACK